MSEGYDASVDPQYQTSVDSQQQQIYDAQQPVYDESNYVQDTAQQNYDEYQQQYQDPNYTDQQYAAYPADSTQPTNQPDDQYYNNSSYYNQEPGENYYTDGEQQQPGDNTAYAQPTLDGSGNVAVGEDSSTTYSDNINMIPQQQDGSGYVGGQIPPSTTTENTIPYGNAAESSGTNIPPNYLESETDSSSTAAVAVQQVKQITTNDESDFDFSASAN